MAGLADIIDSGIQGVGVDGEIQGGRVSKNLAGIGVDFKLLKTLWVVGTLKLHNVSNKN